MTEIGMLITGVFKIRSPNLSHLPEQQPFQQINAGDDLAKTEATHLDNAAQVTTPEFIQIDVKDSDQFTNLTTKREQIVKQIKQKQLISSSDLTPSPDLPPTDKNAKQLIIAYQTYYRQPMPILRFGSSGIPVRILQQLLVSNGYGIKVDGIFGPLTETAVKAFQSQRNLLTDGIVGRITWWQLTV